MGAGQTVAPSPGDDGAMAENTNPNSQLLVQVAASGCVRTRKAAEDLRDYMLKGNYERQYITLYRAVLALLGDLSALATLPEPQYSVAVAVYRKMKAQYIDESECRCLRTATGGVATHLTSCPVHGQTKGARPGMRNLEGLMPAGTGGRPR